MSILNLINFIKNLIFRKEKEKESDWRDGLVPSPPDFRDITMEAVLGLDESRLAPLPEKYRIPYILKVKNQGNTPTCVGQSSASLKEQKELVEGNDLEFDGQWIYDEAKKIDGIPNIRGTYFRIGLKILQKVGAKPLGNDSERQISDFKIGAYISIPCEFEMLKRAIYQFDCILMGFRGSNEGWKTTYVRPPKVGENQWGHAVVVGVGYNKDYIIFQNSWGGNWGDKGMGYVGKDYLPFEAWAVISDPPTNFIDETEKPKFFFQNNLYVGLRNEEVRILQDCLRWIGCLSKAQESTGYFGQITLEAVKLFQQRYQISPVSGYVGPLTRDKLNEFFNL